MQSYHRLNPKAAAGPDGIGWEQYGVDLTRKIARLYERLRTGKYKASAGRRVRIPKADGKERLLVIANLEDKIVQTAVSEVLTAIYEEDFVGFSYGFRPGRGQHDALDALSAAILGKRVNWILDADIQAFFDSIDHKLLLERLQIRIHDPRMLSWIRQWLNAGVMESGRIERSTKGIPQGGAISPLLANVFLHYVYDQWVQTWRKQRARGEVIVVRYADDTIVGFQYEDDAKCFVEALKEQLQGNALNLHPDKTHLVMFGRYAAERARQRKEQREGSFGFLGFTHLCGKSAGGNFLLVRHTIAKRQRKRLQAMKEELRYRRHEPIEQQGQWLASVVRGYFAYHAVPTNGHALNQFRTALTRLWWQSLNRRSQKRSVNWERMTRLKEQWLPRAQILHPWPLERFHAKTRGGSPMR
jgi:group II intron reverse transcriptase/maturase